MKLPGAFTMPYLIVRMLTGAIINKQFQLMKTSDDKQFFHRQQAGELSQISRKYAAILNDISDRFSKITQQANEAALQATDFNDVKQANNAEMARLSNEMKKLDAEKSAVTTKQTAEESAIQTKVNTKENQMDMLIEMHETNVKALQADRDGWQKVLDSTAKGGG